MSLLSKCPVCEADLPPQSPAGLCTKCVFKLMLGRPEPPAAKPKPVFPRPFGSYELLGEIARGGMGVVYRARQVALHRLVALKVIVGADASAPDFRRRFRIEAEAAAGLDHPNIVPIYEIGEVDGQPFFSMKLVDGPHLHPGLGLRRAAALVATLARAVHHAHQRGIIHRDLKPNNVLLDAQGEPQLTDFGLAKLVERESAITRTIAVLGTPSYMAPEQARGDNQHITTAADVYGLGAILYELVAGQPPFVGGTTLETIRLVLDKEPRRPASLNPKVERDLETICLKCLDKEPSRRYGSAEALANDLERWLRHEPITARSASIPQRAGKWAHRHPGVAALLGLLLVSLVLGFTLTLSQSVARQRALIASRRSLYAARIGLAQEAWTAGHVHRARDLLQSLAPLASQDDLRGFEWRYLWGICRDESFLTVSNLEHAVQSVAVSPDGRLLAVVGDQPDVLLWNVAARSIEARLPAGAGNNCVVFSPDGTQVAVAGADKSIRILAVADGRESVVLAGLMHPARQVAFSPNGQWLASASRLDGAIKLWDLATKTEKATFGRIPNQYPAVAFSPDSSTLAWTSGDHAIQLTDVASGRVRARLTGHGGPVDCVVFSPNGKWLASGSKDADARLWDVETGANLATFPSQGAMLTSVAFSPDSKLLLTAGADGTMNLWNVPARDELTAHMGHEELATFKGHEMWVNHALFLPDGHTIVSGGEDGNLKFWSVRRDSRTPMLEYHSAVQAGALQEDLMQESEANDGFLRQDACEVRFCAGGSKLAVFDDRGIIQVWDGEVKHALNVLPLPDAAAMATVFFPDGQQAVSAGSDNQLRLWRFNAPVAPVSVAHLGVPATRLAISADGRRLGVGTGDGHIVIWDTGSWQPVATNSYGPGQLTALKFHPHLRVLLAAVKISDGTNALVRIDLETRAVRFSPEYFQGPVTAIAVSHNAGVIAGSSRDGLVRLWESDSLVLAGTFRGHSGYVTSSAFSPDGRTLATASNDGTVKLWAVDSREELLTLPGHIAPWTQLAFSPDGTELAACGEAGLIRVWRAALLPDLH